MLGAMMSVRLAFAVFGRPSCAASAPKRPRCSTANRARSPSARACCGRARSLSELAEFFVKFRERLEQIGDQTVVGDLEDRRFLVLVDGDDDLGILHAGEM